MHGEFSSRDTSKRSRLGRPTSSTGRRVSSPNAPRVALRVMPLSIAPAATVLTPGGYGSRTGRDRFDSLHGRLLSFCYCAGPPLVRGDRPVSDVHCCEAASRKLDTSRAVRRHMGHIQAAAEDSHSRLQRVQRRTRAGRASGRHATASRTARVHWYGCAVEGLGHRGGQDGAWVYDLRRWSSDSGRRERTMRSWKR